MFERRFLVAAGTIGIVILVLCSILILSRLDIWKKGGPVVINEPTETPKGPPSDEPKGIPPVVDKLIAKVQDQQRAGELDAARKELEGLRKRSDLTPLQKDQIERNLQLVEDKLSASSWVRKDGDERGKPTDPVPKKSFLEYYGKDRKIRSLAIVNVTGTGQNSAWGLSGRAHFAYQYRVAAETTVKSNNGSRAIFALYFPEVIQQRACSESTLELELPDTPLLTGIWKLVEERGLRKFPVYAVVRDVADVALLVDPNLKGVLTSFKDLLRIKDGDHVELAAQLEKLSGQKLEIEYVRDVGITRIGVLEGQTLPQGYLASLAYNSSLLMDYYVFPATKHKVGESWPVNAHDIAGLVNFGYEASASGDLNVTRGEDTAKQGEPLALLKITGGEVSVAYEEGGVNERFSLKPRSTLILFSEKDLLIREARLKWGVTLDKVWKNHLLFGTKQFRDVNIETYYEAEIIAKSNGESGEKQDQK